MKLEKLNDVYLRVECGDDIAHELSDYFTFFVPGYKFMPAFKSRNWDGKIRLFNLRNRLIYYGLKHHIETFCLERQYDFKLDESFLETEFSLHEAKTFLQNIGLTLTPRDYQIEAFVSAIRNNRSLLVSPTASGKSLIIYLLTRFYNRKTLIVVPTTSLVHQMHSDFSNYGYDSEKYAHKIFEGQEKDSDKQVIISTWQSIFKKPKSWFDQFDVVIGDEAHLFKSRSLVSIMTKLENCKYRFGFTGTLDGTETHRLVLEGLFGPVRVVTSTSELMEQKHISDLTIKAIVLNYDEELKLSTRNYTYQEEMDFLVQYCPRNNFIKNLVLSLEGNTLLLYQYVEKHGRILKDSLENKGLKVFFIHGGVDGKERDEIRNIVETNDKCVIVASFGTFSTGISINNLNNIIFASPSKSRIRNLQSIGRGLRKSSTKTSATLFDIADDLSIRNNRNYTLNHFYERIQIYAEEKFNYKIYRVKLK